MILFNINIILRLFKQKLKIIKICDIYILPEILIINV